MQSSSARPVPDGPGAMAARQASSRRVSLALAFSLLLHAAFLWLPHVHLPHTRVDLPPLTARLEPRSAPSAEKPAARPEMKPITLPDQTGGGLPVKQNNVAAATVPVAEKSPQTPPFPRRLQLVFKVYRGEGITEVGELTHQLDVEGDDYSLKAIRQMSGPAVPEDAGQLIQNSYGKIGERGLQPDIFKEGKTGENGKQSLQVTFDWKAGKLHFSQGADIPLPADTQDILSFLYQFSQLAIMSTGVEFFPVTFSDGTQLQQQQIEIGVKEDIATPMGKVHTLHLRKMHSQGEAYFEIWLGLEYRMLPVKIRQVDSSDKVIEESVISGIHVEE
jgi:hypothetical protein